ncbi:hypothetical protein I3843_04G010900 [Carya illinoinensis]|nr:hypothetical protein I3760_04G011100 [Carya illinoinensis]KAG7981724.1 hypothetical protein I3843_04G010900 [Carya illinoinensis]
MGKAKRELMSSAPWRVEEESTEEFRDAKLKVTKQPGAEPVMHVPQKKKDKSKRYDHEDDNSLVEIDPQLRYSFQRNYQVSLSLSRQQLIFCWLNCRLNTGS